MLDYGEEELAARRLHELVHADDRGMALASFERLTGGESETAQLELRLVKKNGEVVRARVTGSTVLDEHGKPVFVVGTAEDLGEYRRREEAEIATRESMARLIEATDAIVVGLDAEGKIELVNPSFESITGYSLADLENRNWFETLVPKDRYPQVWEEFLRLTSGGTPTRFENPILTKGGEERFIVWRNSNLEQAGEIVGTISIGIDITERRRAEQALEDSEQKLLAVFTSVPVAIAVADPNSGYIYDVNQEYERLFECSYDEVVGKTSTELGLWVDPNDRQRMVGLIEKEGKAEGLELALRTRKGRDLIVRTNVLPVTVAGTRYLIYALADITERKQAEEQLALMKHSIDSHYDGAYWMDTDNKCFYVNDAGCKAVGYTREELIGKHASFLNPHATPEALENLWERLRSDGFFVAESTHRRKDGSEFPVEIVATYVQFGGNEYNCGFARDVSARKQAEEERAQLAEELLQAQKLQAVGKLAGGVAHSFNNILTTVVGYTEMLLAKLPQDSEYRSDAEQIKRAADHATAVTRELLLFSRRETGRHARLDLNTVVVQTRLLLRQLLRSDIEIVTALAPTVAQVEADRSQIEQVLVNLFLNASDAMPNGGAIAIETAEAEVDKAIVRGGTLIEPGHYVTLTVKDSGAGMDEETKAHIFEPFFTTKGDGGSVGLGLSTVYGIVEESGGRIVVDSEPSKGSRFTIYLPALSGHHQSG